MVRGGWRVGFVVVLGGNGNYQLGDGAERYTINPTPPTGLPGPSSAISAFGGGTLALSGGTWFGWGEGGSGELCNGLTDSSIAPVSTDYPTSAVKVAGGMFHSLVLTSAGGVQGCGSGVGGQLGDGHEYDGSEYFKTSLVDVTGLSSGVVDVAAGAAHSLAVLDDGTVRSWGINTDGQLGDGTTTNRSTPVAVPGLGDALSVAAGNTHSLAVTSAGTVVAWGQNVYGQLGDASQVDRTEPVAVAGLTGAVAVAASNYWSMALKGDGTVWTWGGNFAGALGRSGGSSPVPQVVPGVSGIEAIAAGENHAVALKNDGTVITWGSNNDRQLGNATNANPGLPSPITGLSAVEAIDAGRAHTSVLRDDGTVMTWGGNVSGSSTATYVRSKTSPAAVVAPGDAGIVSVSGGAGHVLALTGVGDVLAWGANNYGQLGNGGTAPEGSGSATPLPVAGLGTGVRQVATGTAYSSFALRANGSVAAWGWNSHGQLGNGTTTDSPTPVNVLGLDQPAISVAVGGYHGLAVMADQTVRSWGSNLSGQLGDGTTTSRTSAASVSGMTGVIAVGAGHESSYAVTNSGALWAWGNNENGQLGDGTTTNQPIPTLVEGLTNVSAVSGGFRHAIALRNDGTVWAWGANYPGLLGDGTTDQRLVPGQVHGLSDVVAIAAGMNHNLALRQDGTVLSWGYNGEGQVGDGSTNDALEPTTVTGLSDPAQSIGVGGNSSYAVVGAGDSDDDGVSDEVDDNAGGVGAFRDSIGGRTDTYGQIISVADGLTVSITDAPDPEGIQVAVSPGTGRVRLRLCGDTAPPGFIVSVYAGSTGTFECGSVIATTRAGQVTIDLSSDTYVTVPPNVTTEVAAGTEGTFQIVSVTGGSVQLIVDGQPGRSVNGPTSFAAWTFEGFSQPVDTLPVVNEVKAGQGVPLRWRLVDDRNNPVTTLESAKIRVAGLTCSSGSTTDKLEEVAAGSSGLQNLGNGYYQMAWKTPKDYAGSCKTLRLDLGEGITRDAAFRFTR